MKGLQGGGHISREIKEWSQPSLASKLTLYTKAAGTSGQGTVLGTRSSTRGVTKYMGSTRFSKSTMINSCLFWRKK